VDFLRVFQAGQHALGLVRRDVAQQVGGLVRLHLVDDADQRLAGQGRCQLGDLLVVHLFQDVRRVVRVELGQERDLGGVIQLGKDLGLVGGAQRLDDADGAGHIVLLQGMANLIEYRIKDSRLHVTPPGMLTCPWGRPGAGWRGLSGGGGTACQGPGYEVVICCAASGPGIQTGRGRSFVHPGKSFIAMRCHDSPHRWGLCQSPNPGGRRKRGRVAGRTVGAQLSHTRHGAMSRAATLIRVS